MNGQKTPNRHYTLRTAPQGIVAIMAAQSLSSAQQQAGTIFAEKQPSVSGTTWIEESTIEDILQVMGNGGQLPLLS